MSVKEKNLNNNVVKDKYLSIDFMIIK